jgi:hypothetical protein
MHTFLTFMSRLWLVITGLYLLFQLAWFDGAFIFPHQILSERTGNAHWIALTTDYVDWVGIRGGNRFWQLKIRQADADALRKKCTGPTDVWPAESRHQKIQLVIPGQPVPPTEKRLQPLQGCTFGDWSDPGGGYGFSFALQGTHIQIDEWVD